MSSVQNKSQSTLPPSYLVRLPDAQETGKNSYMTGRTDTAMQNPNLRPGSRDQTNGNPSGLGTASYSAMATGWGQTASIWSKPSASFSTALTSTPTARDTSSSRGLSQISTRALSNTSIHQPPDATFKPRTHELVEGKTGSSALVDSSVSDDSWATLASAFSTKITNRSTVDCNPATSQAYGGASRHQSTSTFPSRHLPVSLATTSTGTTNGTRGPFVNTFEMPATFHGNVNISEPPQVFTKFTNQPRPTDSAWGDGPVMHSPSDERKSSVNTAFGFPSQPSSRNNSVPPSRHSDVQPQYPVRSDIYGDAQTATRQNSVSGPLRSDNSGAYKADASLNPLSIQFAQMNFVPGQGQSSAGQQRGSVSGYFGQAPSQGHLPPTMTSNSPYGALNMNYESEDVEDIPRSFSGGDNYSTQTNGDSVGYRMPQFDGRPPYANNAAQYTRQTSHYPGSAAAQRSFDHLNASQSINNFNNAPGGHAAVLEQRLRQVQQEYQFGQDARHMAMMRPVTQNMYGQYAFVHGMPVYNMQIHPSFAQGLPMGMMPAMDLSVIPRAPREHFDLAHGVRSQLLEDFKQSAKTNTRFELKDIYDHVVEFSGDQHGSRFIQLKLETANSDEKERIFREIQPNALQLMTDVFGNYVIQKFFEHGDQTQKKVLASRMKGQVRQLSVQMYGCRVVQKALEHILNDQQASLVRELKDDVLRCVKDQNGNHVIQKAIERCESKDIDFIFHAFTNQIHTLSIHTYGCRVIQRCLEHCELPTRRVILRELQESMPGLIGDSFGNYVVQHVVKHGEEHDKQKVYDLVIKGLEGFSKHKFASNVVEVCLKFASDGWRKQVLNMVVEGNRREGEGMLIGLIRDNYANYVIQRLVDVISQADYYSFIPILQQELNRAKRTGCGKQVLAIEQKMHRFGPAYGSHQASGPTPYSISAATTPPPLTSDARSVQTSSAASINSDAMEGAGIAASRKGSLPGSEPSVYDYCQ